MGIPSVFNKRGSFSMTQERYLECHSYKRGLFIVIQKGLFGVIQKGYLQCHTKGSLQCHTRGVASVLYKWKSYMNIVYASFIDHYKPLQIYGRNNIERICL